MAESRCPKDLKEMISTAKSKVSGSGEEPIEALAKLRGLAADDKTENAMLRSRIEEQCELIMILKQRADEVSKELKTSQRICETLEEFRKNAQGSIDMEVQKCEMLDRRFNELADNHAELIKFKDQYKCENEVLRKENAKLKEDNETLFSGAIQEKDLIIEDLETQLKKIKNRCNEYEKKAMEAHASMMDNRKVLQERLEITESNLNTIIANLEKQLAETERKLKDITLRYNEQHKNTEGLQIETTEKVKQLTKERDDLLALVMQRGKIIEEKVAENKKLTNRVDDARKRQKEAEDRFEREAEAVDSNIQVIKLRKELMQSQDHMTDVDKKFEAYKTHTNKLLQQERDLNAKLRHLAA